MLTTKKDHQKGQPTAIRTVASDTNFFGLTKSDDKKKANINDLTDLDKVKDP